MTDATMTLPKQAHNDLLFDRFSATLALIITVLICLAGEISNGMGAFLIWALLYGFMYVVCLPINIAKQRKHPNLLPICILTIVGSFTIFLWLGALIWAVAALPEQKQG